MSKEEIRDICMLLDRLRSDCEYYLYSTCGYRCPRLLWAHDEQKQIDKMRELHGMLPREPGWLTREQIDAYAEKMGVQ